MKVLLEIKDSKAEFVMELLGNLPYVKVKQVDMPKEELMESIKNSVEDIKLAKAGKKKLQSAKDMLDEL